MVISSGTSTSSIIERSPGSLISFSYLKISRRPGKTFGVSQTILAFHFRYLNQPKITLTRKSPQPSFTHSFSIFSNSSFLNKNKLSESSSSLNQSNPQQLFHQIS